MTHAGEHNARDRQYDGEGEQDSPARQLVLAQAPLRARHQQHLVKEGLL